jgi:cytochrome c biogenesis protein CcmG/thiol:disulfide interchange protein DsbE
MHLTTRLALALIISCSCFAVHCGSSSETSAVSAEMESELLDLPSEEINDLDTQGRTLSLSKLKGKVVVLNFWGSWCGPCRYETPDLVKMYQELNGKGLEVLAVNYGDEKESALAFMNKYQVRYPVIFDRGYTDLYSIGSFPTNIVIDRRGRIRYRLEGFSPSAMGLLRRIAEYLLAQA